MTTDDYEPRELDATTPSAARMYHYYLTGEAVYASDKIFGERMFALCPYLDIWAHHNRGFLQRASRFMVQAGIRQFLDIGSGLPTAGNTHHVTRETGQHTRVVYIDNDLEAVNRAHHLLTEENVLDSTAIIAGDLRHPDTIFQAPDTRRLIDWRQPLGMLIVSVWPFISDAERPVELMAQLRERLPAGSAVAMTHVSVAEATDQAKHDVAAVAGSYTQTSDPITMRNRQQFAAFFDGFELVEPGIVYAPDWRAEQPVDLNDPARPCNFAAVGLLT